MRRFGLIGEHLSHSASAEFFAAKFERENISDAEYRLYELPDITCVDSFMATTPDLCGFNVTIPYKQQIIPYLDALSDDARNVGAVNCVKILPDGRSVGYNTDVVGLRVSMSNFFGLQPPQRALLLGTGGASQAVQYVLAEFNIEFDIVSRDPMKGNLTYQDITAEVVADHKLIINSTPVGTFPKVDDAPMLPYAFVTPDHLLFDLVYNPPLTQFLRYGQERGARICNGREMLTEQADAAWRIWTE